MSDPLVEQVESDAVLPPLHHVVVEGRRVPAVAALPLVGLLPQRGSASHRLPQAVPGGGARAAVVDGGVVVGVGGGGVDALVVPVRAEQVVLVVVEEVRVVGEVLLRLQVLEGRGRGGGHRGGRERRWQRGQRRERGNWGGQRRRRGFWVGVGQVVVLVVQMVVVVLGEVVRMLHVGAAAAVVHVHDVRLAVLRVVVEDSGKVGDG